MKTIYITRRAFIERLRAINRPMPISYIAMVDAKAKATDNYLGGRLFKLSRYSCWIGDYESMVNHQREREHLRPSFAARPRQWGKHLSEALVHHVLKTGEERYYLSAQILRAPKPLYLVERIEAHLRRRRKRLIGVPKEEIAHLLPDSVEPQRQGTRKPIIHRDTDVSHILVACMCGDIYRIEPDPVESPVLARPPSRPRREHDPMDEGRHTMDLEGQDYR